MSRIEFRSDDNEWMQTFPEQLNGDLQRAGLVGRTNLAILLWQMDAENNTLRIQELLSLALTDAQRLQLPEAEQIEAIIQHLEL